MQELRIIEDGVEFYDLGVLHRPSRGNVVAVHSLDVVRSLIAVNRAERVDAVRSVEVVASRAESVRDDPGSRPALIADAVITWADVDGISKPSLKLLTENAPDARPLEASDEQVLEWVGGSSRRAQLVVAALQKIRGSMAGGGDEDA